jgi:hypothetical protein
LKKPGTKKNQFKYKKRFSSLPERFLFFITIKNHSASATTSFTSGIILFIMPSMPALSVIMLEGQPLQLPYSIRFTMPSL